MNLKRAIEISAARAVEIAESMSEYIEVP